MEAMLNCGTLTTQIASIMDVLVKASVAEISKAVEDSLVVLRLQVYERESEIDTLRKNLQAVSSELRATRHALVRKCVNGLAVETQLVINREERDGTVDDDGHGEDETEDVAFRLPAVKAEPREEPVDQKTIQASKIDDGLDSRFAAHIRQAQIYSLEDDIQTHSSEEASGYSEPIANPHLSAARLDLARISPEESFEATDEILQQRDSVELPHEHPSIPHTHFRSLLPLSPGDEDGLGLGGHGLSPHTQHKALNGAYLRERRFPCAFCGKSFDRLSHLERHQRIHTGEKPFTCGFCGRGFTQKSSMKGHLKTHRGVFTDVEGATCLLDGQHLENWDTQACPEEQADHVLSRESQGPITCSEESASLMHVDEGGWPGQETHSEQQSTHLTNPEEEDQSTQDEQEEECVSGYVPHADDHRDGAMHLASGYSDDDLHNLEHGMKAEQEDEDMTLNQDQSAPEHETGAKIDQFPDSVHEVAGEATDAQSTLSKPYSKDQETGNPDSNVTKHSPRAVSDERKRQPEPSGEALNRHTGNEAKLGHKHQGIRVKEEPGTSPLESEGTELSLIHSSLSGERQEASSQQSQHGGSPPAANYRLREYVTVSDSSLPCHNNHQKNGVLEQQIYDRDELLQRKKRFLCLLCGKSFDRLSHLERHQRIHTGEKPYSCGVCGRSFTQKSALKGHYRTHTGERPYSCDHCGLTFSSTSTRNRHRCRQDVSLAYLQ